MKTLRHLIDERTDWQKVQSDNPFGTALTRFAVPPISEDCNLPSRPEVAALASKIASALKTLPPSKADEIRAAQHYLGQLYVEHGTLAGIVRGWRHHARALDRSARVAAGNHEEGPLRRRLGEILQLETLASETERRYLEPIRTEVEELERAIESFIQDK